MEPDAAYNEPVRDEEGGDDLPTEDIHLTEDDHPTEDMEASALVLPDAICDAVEDGCEATVGPWLDAQAEGQEHGQNVAINARESRLQCTLLMMASDHQRTNMVEYLLWREADVHHLS